MDWFDWSRQPIVVRSVFWIFAVIVSLFYGWKCFDALDVTDKNGVKIKVKDKPWAWRLHQHWFNFSGSLVGWAAFWLVFRKVVLYSSPIHWFDAAIMFVAFVGITGHLPFAAMGLIQGTKELAEKVLKLS